MDARTVKVSGLGALTVTPGVYEFVVLSGAVRDSAGNVLPADASVTWGLRPADPADATPPTSRVAALPGESDPSFVVTWSGDDGTGGGVASFTVYASADGGPFAVWLTETTLTAATFPGRPGHTYAFYSLAKDVAGNAEASKSAGEATTFAPAASVSGTLFHDLNADGVRQTGEPGLAGRSLFLDLNADGAAGTGEPVPVTDADGNYTFGGLAAGTYTVVPVLLPGWFSAGGAAGVFAAVEPTAGANAGGDGAAALVGLDRLRRDPRFAQADGRGGTIVFIDSGLSAAGGDFGPDADGDGVPDVVMYQYDFVEGDFVAQDAGGHGTGVAGLAAGRSGAVRGVASGAGLIVLRVLDAGGRGDFANVERALRWVADNAALYNVVAVDLSFGDGGGSEGRAAGYGLGDEFAALERAGVVVVAAAGNNRAASVGVAYPASDPYVLSVGAVWSADRGAASWRSGARDDSSGPDRLVSFSQRDAAGRTVFAPGATVTTDGPDGRAVSFSGTSAATPFVTGAVAVAQQLAREALGRRLTAAEVRDLISRTGAWVTDGDDERDNVAHTRVAFRRLDVFALAAAVLTLPAVAPPDAPPPAETPGGASPVAASTAGSRSVTVRRGVAVTVIDFGSYSPGSIGGVIFGDADGDGVPSTGENRVPGVTVFLDADGDARPGPGERTAVTGDGGRYEFTGLTPGTYRVGVVVPAGWRGGPPAAAATVVSATATEAPALGILPPPAPNTPPTISAVGDIAVPSDGRVATIRFTVGDAETGPDGLSVTVSSSDDGLLPVSGFRLDGRGADRTLTLTPAAGRSGRATVTLAVTDASGLATTRSFVVTVEAPANTPPVIGPIVDLTVEAGGVSPTIGFTVSDFETAAAGLVVTVTTSDEAVLPAAAVSLGGSGGGRTLTVSPPAGRSGTVTVWVTVTDAAGTTATTEFRVTVAAPAPAAPPPGWSARPGTPPGRGRGPRRPPGCSRTPGRSPSRSGRTAQISPAGRGSPSPT